MNLLGKGFADKNETIKGIRRADKFAKMAVIASDKACAGFEFQKEDTDISIILCTQFGPHATTFKFLDTLLDYSDTGVSPTTFSHSVHNAAASYIASFLGIRGQSLTITSFQDPLRQALILADAWLEQKQAEKIIVCYVDEESDPLCMVHKHCTFPSYSKEKLFTGAASVLLEKGDNINIPDQIINPFNFIEEM
ncbi:MAG: beta-ketoacyl synthase chain length factor [Desulfobacteraceae bacterium]|nr:beta-ketoacyl synthase chain length factor [Desulfobacteraceae bacterium]